MASRQESDTEFEPRHRILGAIVLVALGFILFSVVLNEQPQRLDPGEKTAAVEPHTRVVVTPVPTPNMVVPSSAKTPVRTRTVANPLAPKHLEKKTLKTPASDQNVPIKPVVAKAAPVKKSVPVSKKSATVSSKHWMVQVGTFSDPANARRLSEKLKSQKYQVVTKVITLKAGSAVRVRVGPYTSLNSATTARDQIKRKNGIKGVVLAQN